MKNIESFDSLVVVKRSGQRCDFQGEKIAIAIKKAFDSVEKEYQPSDVNAIYSTVLRKITVQYHDRKTIKIEDIQDIIEATLKEKNYELVYESFKTYREQRNLSRESFTVKEQHKFLKAMEKLGLNGKDDPKLLGEKLPPSQMFHNFGMVISKEFTESYLLDNKTVRSFDSGLLYFHNLDFYPMGTTNSIQLLYQSLLEETTESVMDAFMQLSRIIRRIFSEQHGNIMIPFFEKELEPFLIRNFSMIWKSTIALKIGAFGLQAILPMQETYEQIDKLKSLQIKLEDFSFFYQNSKQMENLFLDSYRESLEELQQTLKKSFQWFFDELEFSYEQNLKHQTVSVSFGTQATLAGMMIQKVLIDVLKEKKRISIKGIYKVKQGINYEKTDPAYEVFERIKEVYVKGIVDLEFLDVSYNQNHEVCYGIKGERVYDDNTTQDAILIGKKGSLSYTSINLPRLALRHINEDNLDGFYEELKETLDLAKNEMLERFEFQCSKHSYNFPYLIGKGIWRYGESVKENDRLRKVLKHGVLQLHFVGLYETMELLMGKNMENDKTCYEEAIRLVTMMYETMKRYSLENNLNFALCDTELEDVTKIFLELDRAIYGKVKGVTDHERYQNAFYLPKKIDWKKRVELEGVFHAMCKGGHVFEFKKPDKAVDFNRVFQWMIKNEIGFTTYVD